MKADDVRVFSGIRHNSRLSLSKGTCQAVRIASFALSCALVVAACAQPPATPTDAAASARVSPNQRPRPATAVVSPANRVKVMGRVRVPPNVTLGGDVKLIGVDGASLEDGSTGKIISDGGMRFKGTAFQLSSLENQRVEGVRVFVADGAGQPVPGIPEGKTNDSGEFTLSEVPPGETFVLIAEVPTDRGVPAQLRTVVKVGNYGATTVLDAASTLVSFNVLGDLRGGELGDFNPSKFETATKATERSLNAENLPDFTDVVAIKTRMDKLIRTVDELRDLLDELRADLTEIKTAIDSLRASATQDVTDAPSVAPSVEPTPGPDAPQPSSVPPLNPSSPTPAPTPTDSASAPVPNAPPTQTPSSTPAPANPSTPAPQLYVETLAGGAMGYANGSLASARFNNPYSLEVLPDGTLFVADTYQHCIRMIAQNQVSVYAGVPGSYGPEDGRKLAQSRFYFPNGMALDQFGVLYVADYYNDAIRKIFWGADSVKTVAGSVVGYLDGAADEAKFDGPSDVAVAPDGTIFVADTYNHRIRRIAPNARNNGRLEVTTLAGSSKGFSDGPGPAARFDTPTDLVLAPDGSLYVSDMHNHRIRKISPSGLVTTFAGGDEGYRNGLRVQAEFSMPLGLALAADGTLYVSDVLNHNIRAISPEGMVSTLAGSETGEKGWRDAVGTSALFNSPSGLAVGSDGTVYVADYGNHRIRTVKWR
jgi:sugar lactone lactonase YvrE